jgi:hypothetical protein
MLRVTGPVGHEDPLQEFGVDASIVLAVFQVSPGADKTAGGGILIPDILHPPS